MPKLLLISLLVLLSSSLHATESSHWRELIKGKIPAWTSEKAFLLMHGQWIGLFVLTLFGFLLERMIRAYLANVAIKLLGRKGINIPEELKKRFTLPIRIVTFALLWNIGLPLLGMESSTFPWLLRIGKVIFTFGIIMTLYQSVDLVSLYFQRKADLSLNKFDDILVPLIRKSAKTFVIAIGIIAVGDSLTFDIKGILAGMGIIGLGISLAAKDTLSNLFGSLTVLLDRPFHIGDWVVIDGNIEGVIEEVGLRSCRVRTFYDSLITLPNGRLTNAPIDNYGKRQYRRLTTTICLQYDTPHEKVEAFCEAIRQLILKHPHTRKDYFHVYLSQMASSGLEILLYVFFIVPDWSQELQEKHRLLMDILRLGNNMGIELAFPTQTLHMINQSPTTYDNQPKPGEILKYGQQQAAKIIEEPITPQSHRSGKNKFD